MAALPGVTTARLAGVLVLTFGLAAGLAASLPQLGIPGRIGAAVLQPLQWFVDARQDADAWQGLQRGHDHSARPPRRPLFEATFFDRRLIGTGFAHPPTALLAMHAAALSGPPRALLDILTWLAIPLTALCVAALDRRLDAARGVRRPPREVWARGALALFATLTFYPLMRAYMDSPVHVWTTAGFAALLLAWASGRPALAGALAGAVAALKPQGLVLLAWAAVRGHRRFVAGFAVVFIPLLGLSIAASGLDAHLDYPRVLAFLTARGEAFFQNHAPNGLLHRLVLNGVPLRALPPDGRWWAHFPPPQPFVQAGTLVAGAILVAAALWPPRKDAADPAASTADLAVAWLAAILAAPVAWEHSFGFLLPLFLFLLHGLRAAAERRALLAAWIVASPCGWPLAVALHETRLAPLGSYLLLAGLVVLGLLVRLRRDVAATNPSAAPAGSWRARLDWRPSPALVRTAVQAGLLGALAAALAGFALYRDAMLAQAGTNPLWDPELPYLLSSLLPFEGAAYAFADHPGTPLQMIGTAILALLWPAAAARSETIAAFAIGRPWLFLAAAHALLTAGSIAVAAAVARRAVSIRRLDDVVLGVGAAVAYYVLHAHALQSLVYWSHNSFNVFGIALGLALLLRLRDGPPPSRRWLLAMGAVAGTLAGTQLYLGAWVIGIAIAVGVHTLSAGRGAAAAARAVATVGLAAAAAFACLLVPLGSNVRSFLRFVTALVGHQGIYGTGEAGFSLRTLAANLVELAAVHRNLLVVLVALVGAIAVAAARDRRAGTVDRGSLAVAAGLTVQGAVLLLAIAKHPGPLYVLSLASLLPLLMAVAFTSWRDRGWAGRAACTTVAAVTVAAFAGGYWFYATASRDEVGLLDRSVRRVVAATERAVPPGTRAVRLWTYGTGSTCFALWLSNHIAQGRLTDEVGVQCSADGMAWSGVLAHPSGWLEGDPRATAGMVVSVREEDAAPWGTPEPTGIAPPGMGPYLVVPFSIERLRGLEGAPPPSANPGP